MGGGGGGGSKKRSEPKKNFIGEGGNGETWVAGAKSVDRWRKYWYGRVSTEDIQRRKARKQRGERKVFQGLHEQCKRDYAFLFVVSYSRFP